MSLSDALTIVTTAIPDMPRRQRRPAAITYLNWWNGHSAAMPYSDPTGERAVRAVLATA